MIQYALDQSYCPNMCQTITGYLFIFPFLKFLINFIYAYCI